MTQRVNEKRDELLHIVEQMIATDTLRTGTQREKKQRVHPDLTVAMMTQITADARRIITDMTLMCEVDIHKESAMYEAVSEQRILESGEGQLHQLERVRDAVMFG